MSFQIKRYKKETEKKTIGFPVDLIDKIKGAIKNENITFSRFVIQACKYALDDMEDNKKMELAKHKYL